MQIGNRLISIFFLAFIVALVVPFSSNLSINYAVAQDLTNVNTSYLPIIGLGGNEHIIINFVNNDSVAIDLRVTAYSADGMSLGEVSPIIWLESGEAKDVDAETLPPGTASLKMESTGNIEASIHLQSADSQKSEVILFIADTSTNLEFPTLTAGDIQYKMIKLFTPDSSASQLTFEAFDNNGLLLESNNSYSLSSLQSMSIPLSTVFGKATMTSVSTVRIKSNNNIVGLQFVDIPDGDIVAIPALTTASTGWTFPISTKEADLELWTKVGILNPGDTFASINVEAFDADNKSLGIVDTLSLLPEVAYFISTANINGIIPPNATLLRVRSSQPVNGYEVEGVINGRDITAHMGMPEEDGIMSGSDVLKSFSMLSALSSSCLADAFSGAIGSVQVIYPLAQSQFTCVSQLICGNYKGPDNHTGIDIKTPNSNPDVRSVCKGKVVYNSTKSSKYTNPYKKYWNAFVVIAHDCNNDGITDIYGYYGHLISDLPDGGVFYPGTRASVSAGDVIGQIRLV